MMEKIIGLELSNSVLPPDVSTTNNDELPIYKQEALYNNRYKQDTDWRCRLSWWVVICDSVWILFIIIVVLLQGTDVISLNDVVVISLLGAATANVLGLAFIVLKGLFGARD